MTSDVAAVLPFLEAEVPVWNSDGAIRLAGRVDALILREGRVLGVLDWKSALKPSPEIKSHYVSQLDAYVAVTGAVAGAVVFMTSGELIWIGDREGLLA
jgi:ATP-dependent exoDNAse (exonuclease V) beta subunit